MTNEMVDKSSYLYWFPKQEWLCTYQESGWFYVLNGAWEFKIEHGNAVIKESYLTNQEDLILVRNIERPKAMTRKQFDKLEPNFGY